MKVWNLTDVSTPALKRAGKVNRPLVLWREVIAPGQSVDIPDEVFTPQLKEQAAAYVRLGMLSLGLPPAAYLRAKDLTRDPT